jgi:hypothetical protein
MYKKHLSFSDFRQKIDVSKIKKEIKSTLLNFLETKSNNSKSNFAIIKFVYEDLSGDSIRENKFLLTPNVMMELTAISKENHIRYIESRYKYDVYPSVYKVEKYPPCLQIEPTSICNYRCVFCYQTDLNFFSKKSGEMGSMSLDNFKLIIDQSQNNIDIISLASRGEPTVCKDLDKMLDYTKDKFLNLKINTNASLLNEKLSHAILRNNVQTVVFSADAANKELYSKLRVNGKLETVLKNIKLFLEIKKKNYPNSKIITRVSGVKFNNEQNINDMEEFWGKLVNQVVFVDYNPWENIYSSSINKITNACSDLWRRMFIWWDMRSNPCDVDFKSYLSPGKISEANTISKIWNSNEYNKIRIAHLNNSRSKVDPCNKCSVI